MTTETKTLIGVLVATVVIIIAGGLLAGRQSAVPDGFTGNPVAGERLARESDPFFGPAAGAVTIVEFGDFECPSCAALVPIMKQVKEENPDVKFVYRQFPLTQIHEFAQGAAEASLAAHAQGKFWEYHDVLFANQSQLSRDDLITHAGTVGLDVDRFTRELDEGVYRGEVLQGVTDGNIVGVRGTPSLFINNAPYVGPNSVAAIGQAVTEARGSTSDQ